MHPSSILSYYPTYSILDEVLKSGNYNKMNVFIDLKNTLQSLYMEHCVINLVESSIRSKFIDTSIFASVISFLSFHKIYSVKRNIDMEFYFFFETGRSYYHENIEKGYKKSRKQDALYGLDREKREKFFEVVQKNLMLIEKACNKMPSVKIIRLPNLEADFIPYYLMRNKLVDLSDNVANITYSNDHDLYQNVGPNSYVFLKHPKMKKVLKHGSVMSTYLKFENDIPEEYYPLAMAIIGDSGDDVIGINGIGPKTASKIIEDLVQMTGGMETLYNNVFEGNDIFINTTKNPNKYIDKIIEEEQNNCKISKNLKLVSFEVLSRFFDDPPDTEMLKKKNTLISVLENEETSTYKAMRDSLNSVGVLLEDDTLENIFYSVQK